MSDLIRREDVLNVLRTFGWTPIDGLYLVVEQDIPSADRPQGKWLIEKTLYDNYNYRCSYCDWYECHAYPDVEPYNYCPNCGARMKGVDDE